MKGISLPTDTLVIIAIVILVLAIIGAFFLLQSGTSISDAEAQKVFADGCIQACRDPCDFRYKAGLADEIGASSEFHKKFAQACIKLGYASGTKNENSDESVIALLNDIRGCVAACGENCDTACPYNPSPAA